MMIWIIFALLTLAVIAALLAPLFGSRKAREPAARGDFDKAVFRDQLAEVDRDLARGIIDAADAEAAKNEIARRLLQAAHEAPAKASRSKAIPVAILGALLIPAIAVPLYLRAGTPVLPDVPHADRMANAVKNQDFDAMVAAVEQHLQDNPTDVQGWAVLAPAYRRLERWDDAETAYASLIKLKTPDAVTLADYGEVQVLANQGMVTAKAHDAFKQALAIDPKLPKARFYDVIALKQEGKRSEAEAATQAFLADSPPDAPWRAALQNELKDDTARAPQLSQEQMQAGAQMSAQDRNTMIRSMVDGLEERLKSNGDDLDGWQRLIRARTVLNEPDKAKAALTAAKTQFKDNPDAIAQLDKLASELNLL